MFDVIIIGAGPIGLASAIEAKKKNLSYLVLEKGCLVNSIYNYPKNMVFFSTSDRLEIGNVPFISHGVKPTRTEALEYYRRVKESWMLDVNLYERVERVKKNETGFLVTTSKGSYETQNIIIATGFYDFPNYLGIPGEDLPKVKHYYDEPHPYAGQNVLVIGGGNSAVDVSLETYRRGANVTMVLRKREFESNVKYWVKPDIENRIKEGAIKAYFNSSLLAVREKDVDIQTPEGVITIKNDFVAAMTGYHPDFEFLENCGLELSDDSAREPIHDSETFETTVKGIYIAGVVCSGMNTSRWFIENARYHAENVIKNIAEK